MTAPIQLYSRAFSGPKPRKSTYHSTLVLTSPRVTFLLAKPSRSPRLLASLHLLYISEEDGRPFTSFRSTNNTMDHRFCLLLLLSFILGVAAATSASDALSGAEDPLIRQVIDGNEDQALTDLHHFSIFKRRFGKSYASQEEHDRRFKIFRANLRRARRHQKLDPSAVHGVTQFSDLTPSEFRRTFLGLRSKLRLPKDANQAPILPTENLPADFDWRDRGAVTAVKNQVITFVFLSQNF